MSDLDTEKEARFDLNRIVQWTGEEIELDVPDGVLPDFLIDAHNAAYANDHDHALSLLTSESLDMVARLEQQSYPGMGLVWLILGLVHARCKQPKQALYWYHKVLDLWDHALIYNEIATVYHKMRCYSQALTYRTEALNRAPECLGIQGEYALDLVHGGRLAEGLDMMQALVDRQPTNARLHSSLLWHMHYLPGICQSRIRDASRQWAQRHTPVAWARTHYSNDPDPNRRLRIGYSSADFYRHSTCYNVEAIIEGHDRQAVELFAYSNVSQPDAVTKRVAGKFDHFRSVTHLDDRSLATLIEQDRIDILVILVGHGEGHRLGACAYKPAPIQVQYQGPNTTGMSQVDYIFMDELFNPPGSEGDYVETNVNLTEGWFCYRPPECAPAVGPLPALTRGSVTFGACHGSIKVNRAVVDLWSEVLRQTPGSRLIFKCPGGSDPALRQRYADWFSQCNVDPTRIEIIDWLSPTKHFDLYHQIDIALDAFPLNGCVNTLEALWMGVPTVSLIGTTAVARTGLMILTRVGLGFFACSTEKEYVAKAVTLAGQLDSLAKIRQTMRDRLRASPLLDKRRIAAQLEEKYRLIWQHWCVTGKKG
jgi:protein O-GlcNAc transferase